MSSLSTFPIYRFVWISRKSVLRISQTREDDCGARLGPSFFEEEGTKEEKKKKKKGKKRIAYFSFQSARIRVFVDPLLRARLRARLVHARGNARGFLSFPTSSLCPSSVSCLLLSSLLSLSLWPPWSSGSSYRVAARIVTHKLLSIVGDPRAECFCIPRARAPPFFRGDSLASGFAFHHRILLLFELLLLDRFIFPSEERNIDIDGVVCNFEGSC